MGIPSALVTPAPPASASRRRAMAGPIACGCALAGCAVYAALVDPARRGVFLPCPFRASTGLWCPGCGLTRATHRLLTGDLVGALRYNLFVPVFLLALVYGWGDWLWRSAGRAPRRSVALGQGASVAAALTLVVFGVIRNLPGMEVLRGG